MLIRKTSLIIIVFFLLLFLGCAPKRITGDLFVLSEIVEISDNFRMIGYNLSTNPPQTFLVTTDTESNIEEKRLIGNDLYLKGYANLEENLILLFSGNNNNSLLVLINAQGEIAKKLPLEFQAERLLLHPKGGYVIPGYSKDQKPAVITLDAFWNPSKIIPLKGKHLMDAVLIDSKLVYISMAEKGRVCHIYSGSKDELYEFKNPTGANCSLTTLRNMIQLHYLETPTQLKYISLNIVNRIDASESFKIKKADYFEVTLTDDDSFIYIVQAKGKKNGANQYSLLYKNRYGNFSQIKHPDIKKSVLSKPYEKNNILFFTAYSPVSEKANRNRIITIP